MPGGDPGTEIRSVNRSMPESLATSAGLELPAGQLRVSRFRNESELEPFCEAWRNLAGGVPTRSPQWLLVWWRFYRQEGDELCLVLFHEPDGTLVGLAPLYLAATGGSRTVSLLGSGDASTNHTTWICAPGWEERIGVGVARFLMAAGEEWQRIRLESADAGDPAINATVDELARQGCLVCSTPRHSCWEIALPSSWEEYLKLLSKIHRKRCRKWQQLLDSGRVRIHQVRNAADFPRGFEILLLLHGARWGEPGRPQGCFSDPQFRGFHEAAARELLRHDQLLLVWLELDGRPVAAEYQFADRTTVYSYQAGMDPAIEEFSPGNLSILASIRDAIAKGRSRVDLSRGDQPYKSTWRATPTACRDIRIWPSRIAGRLEHGGWELRNRAERARMRAVTWLKARLPSRLVERGRRVLSRLSGKRRSPRKGGDSK
jgi:CelD/BcsL family acetyltransferase involved in cellulose biosynthesis